MTTEVTGPLKEPLEHLASTLKSEDEVEAWSNLIRDFLMERLVDE